MRREKCVGSSTNNLYHFASLKSLYAQRSNYYIPNLTHYSILQSMGYLFTRIKGSGYQTSLSSRSLVAIARSLVDVKNPIQHHLRSYSERVR